MKDGTIHKQTIYRSGLCAAPRMGERGMTSIASPASSTTAPAGTSTLSPAMARALLVLVTAVSVAAGLLATGTEASASAIALAGAGPDLADGVCPHGRAAAARRAVRRPDTAVARPGGGCAAEYDGGGAAGRIAGAVG